MLTRKQQWRRTRVRKQQWVDLPPEVLALMRADPNMHKSMSWDPSMLTSSAKAMPLPRTSPRPASPDIGKLDVVNTADYAPTPSPGVAPPSAPSGAPVASNIPRSVSLSSLASTSHRRHLFPRNVGSGQLDQHGRPVNGSRGGRGRKSVSFESRVKMILIPRREEINDIDRMRLWWTREDYARFRQVLIDWKKRNAHKLSEHDNILSIDLTDLDEDCELKRRPSASREEFDEAARAKLPGDIAKVELVPGLIVPPDKSATPPANRLEPPPAPVPPLAMPSAAATACAVEDAVLLQEELKRSDSVDAAAEERRISQEHTAATGGAAGTGAPVGDYDFIAIDEEPQAQAEEVKTEVDATAAPPLACVPESTPSLQRRHSHEGSQDSKTQQAANPATPAWNFGMGLWQSAAASFTTMHNKPLAHHSSFDLADGADAASSASVKRASDPLPRAVARSLTAGGSAKQGPRQLEISKLSLRSRDSVEDFRKMQFQLLSTSA